MGFPTFAMIVSSIGVFGSFFAYGIFQEKLIRTKYGDELNIDGSRGEQFIHFYALLGVQALLTTIVSWSE